MPIPSAYREALRQNAAAIQNGQELPASLQPIYQGIRAGGIYWDIFLATGWRNYIDAGISAPIAVWMAPNRNARVDARFWQTVTTNYEIAQTIRDLTTSHRESPETGELGKCASPEGDFCFKIAPLRSLGLSDLLAAVSQSTTST